MVPSYEIDDTIQRVPFVYILMSIFLSSAVFIKFKSQMITTSHPLNYIVHFYNSKSITLIENTKISALTVSPRRLSVD